MKKIMMKLNIVLFGQYNFIYKKSTMSARKSTTTKLPIGLPQTNPINSFITSIWNKKPLPEIDLSQISVVEKRQSEGSEEQNNKVIMSKKQLMQFTKKFAINKIDHEEEIERLRVDLTEKEKRLAILNEQVDQLRTQQDYLIKVMEQLRDRHINQILSLNNKYDNNLKEKQAEIQYLNDELIKIRKWLEQEKLEAKRCIEFLKIKDQIIQKLEWDILKYKNQLKNLKEIKEGHANTGIKTYLSSTLKISDHNDNHTKERTSSAKKIIIRKQKKEEGSNRKQNKQNGQLPQEIKKVVSSRFHHQQSEEIMKLTNIINGLRLEKIQIENEKFEIFSKYREATIENDCLRRAMQKIERDREEDSKIKKSIDDLNEISKRIKESQADKENLLVTKCIFLEKHVEKLTRQLSRVKSSNILQYSKDTFEGLSRYQLFAPIE